MPETEQERRQKEGEPACLDQQDHDWRELPEQGRGLAFISTTSNPVMVDQAVCTNCGVLRERFVDVASPEDPAPFWTTFRYPQLEAYEARQGESLH
jgi:hypothetical protein